MRLRSAPRELQALQGLWQGCGKAVSGMPVRRCWHFIEGGHGISVCTKPPSLIDGIPVNAKLIADIILSNKLADYQLQRNQSKHRIRGTDELLSPPAAAAASAAASSGQRQATLYTSPAGDGAAQVSYTTWNAGQGLAVHNIGSLCRPSLRCHTSRTLRSAS